MASLRKTPVSLDWLCFSTPEQKLLKLFLSEPTTAFNIRAISSKLKGVRGLGGAEGIQNILEELHELGFVDFLDNQRSARLRDENAVVKMLKKFVAVCDLENLSRILEPLSRRGILYGPRALGDASSDSLYDLCVVVSSLDQEPKIKETVEGHPMGKQITLQVVSSDDFESLARKNSSLNKKLEGSIILWMSSGWS